MAVKILHAHMTVNEDLRRRFRDEAQAVAALRHPNIVQVSDFDVVDDRPYIIMELLEGMPLNEYLRGLHGMGHTLPLDTVSRLMTSLTAALDYAHNRQIVHRDVKPANIVLRAGDTPITPQMPLAPDVEPVLTDFGVARIATSTSATASGTILSTPAYMSPEQVRGEAVDRRSDIYALGIILYEVLAGKLPFNAETDTPASILYKHVHEPAPVVPDVSPSIQRVVEKSLAKDRDARYQQAGELAADLALATKSDTAPATPAPAVTAVATDPPAARVPSEPAHKLRPSLILIAGTIFGAIVLVGGVVVGGQLVGGAEDESSSPQTQATDVREVVASEVAPPPNFRGWCPGRANYCPSARERTSISGRHQGQQSGIPASRSEHAACGTVLPRLVVGRSRVLPLHLNRNGTVELLGDELIISFVHPDGVNLLAQYARFVISLEEEGSLLAQPSTIIFEGSFDSDATQLVRLADEEKRGEAVLQNLRSWLPLQVNHFITHSGFALDGIQREDLPYVKTHSEHTLNIVEGRTGELYQDWDGGGTAQNPGDDVGVVPYLALLRAASVGGSRAEILRGGSGQAGNGFANRADEIGDLIADIRETVRQILLVNTIGDISAFGLDSDLAIKRDLKALIDQLVADSLAVDLAFAFDVFAQE